MRSAHHFTNYINDHRLRLNLRLHHRNFISQNAFEADKLIGFRKESQFSSPFSTSQEADKEYVELFDLKKKKKKKKNEESESRAECLYVYHVEC